MKLWKFLIPTLLVFGAFWLFGTSSPQTLPNQNNPITLNNPTIISTDNKLVQEKTKTVYPLTPSNDQTLYLLGEVTAQSSLALTSDISTKGKAGKPLYLFINSPGGSVIAGAQILSAMEASKAPIHTVCLEICASMAAMVFSFGKDRLMVDRSILMFHPASIGMGGGGELDKQVSQLLFLQRYVDKLDVVVAKRAGMTFERFKFLSGTELWLDGEDAIQMHLADKLVSVTVDPSIFALPPSEYHNRHFNYHRDFIWE